MACILGLPRGAQSLGQTTMPEKGSDCFPGEDRLSGAPCFKVGLGLRPQGLRTVMSRPIPSAIPDFNP